MSVHALFRGGAAQSAAGAATTRSGPLVAAFFAPFAGRAATAAAAVPFAGGSLRAAQVVLAEANIAGDGGEGLETLAVEHFAVQHLVVADAGLGMVVVVEGERSAVPHPVVPAGPPASGGGRRYMATTVPTWAAPTAAAWDNIVECPAG